MSKSIEEDITPDSVLRAMGFRKGKDLGYSVWLRDSDELGTYDDKKCKPLKIHIDVESRDLFNFIYQYGVDCGKKELAIKLRKHLEGAAERTWA